MYFSIVLLYYLSTGSLICLNIVLNIILCIVYVCCVLTHFKGTLKIHYIAGWEIYEQIAIGNREDCLVFGIS